MAVEKDPETYSSEPTITVGDIPGDSVTQNAGPTNEVFVLSGSDGRTAGGAGSISLVSGAFSARSLSGPNANRGWLNFQLTLPSAVPAMTGRGMAGAAGLLALAGAFAVRRWMSRR